MKFPSWLLDPDRAWLFPMQYSHWAHFLFGVLMVVLIRNPVTGWIFSPVVHASVFWQAIVGSFAGLAYEVRDAIDYAIHSPGTIARPDQGFGVVDWAYVTLGSIITAVLISALS